MSPGLFQLSQFIESAPRTGGDEPNSGNARGAVGHVLPARAGMSPRTNTGVGSSECAPRTGGDEPDLVPPLPIRYRAPRTGGDEPPNAD